MLSHCFQFYCILSFFYATKPRNKQKKRLGRTTATQSSALTPFNRLNFCPKLYTARFYLMVLVAVFRLTIWFNSSKLKGLNLLLLWGTSELFALFGFQDFRNKRFNLVTRSYHLNRSILFYSWKSRSRMSPFIKHKTKLHGFKSTISVR